MPVLNSLVRVAAKPLPRMITPRAHAVIDYVIAGSFFATAALFWRRNKRASVAALICGSTRLAVSHLTDYPGGARRPIRFYARREVDLGLAAMTTAMPKFFQFQNEPQKNFFIVQGVLTTVANELTQFTERHHPEKERSRAA